MGDIIEILITGTTEKNASSAFKEAFKEVDRLNKILNKELKYSKISMINQKAWKKPIKCDKELFNIIESSLHYCEITNGGFDITEGSLIEELNKGTKRFHKTEDIASLLNAVFYKNVIIDKNENAEGTIFIRDKRTKLDLSLVAKGYVVDKVIEILEKNSILRALVKFGGIIRVMGNPPGDTVWRIAIPDPKDNGKSIGFLGISDKAVAISGDYEKKIIKSRNKYAHIADLKKQRPFDPQLLETIVVAPAAFEADALSAAAHLSGLNKDMGLIDSISDAEGIDFYEKSDGSLEIEMSNDIKTYFAQKAEPISPQRTRPACAF